MADNYHDTVYRMYEASDLLYENSKWFVSNYLAGYVIECYCKLILQISQQQGHTLSGHKHSVTNFSHRIEDMRNEFAMIALEGCPISSYCLDISAECPTLLMNWNPNERYASDTHLLNTEATAVSIHTELDKLIETILNMEIDGVLI